MQKALAGRNEADETGMKSGGLRGGRRGQAVPGRLQTRKRRGKSESLSFSRLNVTYVDQRQVESARVERRESARE